MNKVIILGRLVKDPVVQYTKTGKCYTQFTVASHRNYKNADGNYDADFINCVAWNKTAEAIGNSISKGHRILLEGSINIRSYEKDGIRKWITEILVSRFEYIEQKINKTGNNFGEETPAPISQEDDYSNIPF